MPACLVPAHSPQCRFWILPCCFWGFSRKFQANDRLLGQYKTYLNFIEKIMQLLRFEYTMVSHSDSTARQCLSYADIRTHCMHAPYT